MNIFQLKQSEVERSQCAAILFSATSGSNTLHLRSQTSGFNCFIDWGDGSTEAAPANGGAVTHSYSSAGDYVIRFYGISWAGIDVNNATGKEKYKGIYSMGKWPIDTLTSMYTAFYACTGLQFISENAFKYVPAITTFFQAFRGCTSLATLPPNLWKYQVNATNFQRALRLIPALQVRDDIWGVDYSTRFNGKTVNFTECFDRSTFTGTQGRAPELWNFTGLTATKTDCFNGAGNSATSLSNYGDIPADWI